MDISRGYLLSCRVFNCLANRRLHFSFTTRHLVANYAQTNRLSRSQGPVTAPKGYSYMLQHSAFDISYKRGSSLKSLLSA